ncbi:MAG: 16S rRNA (uracil(1498)-N(3))-methyltransferase, partial [Cyclobacteriaceae bacterium]|nr:16S rRNA (uracil(1498)-N(3))-methyltransferase [Cyclobacteriaceae bacterium]
MHLFYQKLLKEKIFSLENEEYRHCVQVLRHKEGDVVYVTDGKGLRCEVILTRVAKNECHFEVKNEEVFPPKPFAVHLAIAPTKQTERMEWLVEKVCELGVDELTFVWTQNSERSKLKLDRLEKKSISALKQSKGAWITKLNPPVDLDTFARQDDAAIRLVAAVQAGNAYMGDCLVAGQKTSILIGPEGDFTMEEVGKLKAYQPVSLGQKILRTET